MIGSGEGLGLLTDGVMSNIPAVEATGVLQTERGRGMDAQLWLTFLVAATALLIMPGPDWAFMLASGLRGGGVAALRSSGSASATSWWPSWWPRGSDR